MYGGGMKECRLLFACLLCHVITLIIITVVIIIVIKEMVKVALCVIRICLSFFVSNKQTTPHL